MERQKDKHTKRQRDGVRIETGRQRDEETMIPTERERERKKETDRHMSGEME